MPMEQQITQDMATMAKKGVGSRSFQLADLMDVELMHMMALMISLISAILHYQKEPQIDLLQDGLIHQRQVAKECLYMVQAERLGKDTSSI